MPALARSFGRLLARLDGGVGFRDAPPSPREDATHFPRRSWDLRTVIALFPGGSPLRYLNLNFTLGLTGSPFDRAKGVGRRGARDVFDLQMCLEGRERHATEKACLSIARDVRYLSGGLRLLADDRAGLDGAWPRYQVRYRSPDRAVQLQLALDSWPGVLWWARFGPAYRHYTTFCTARVALTWGEQVWSAEVPALHDHGWGGTLLPARAPLRLFHYQVLRLPGDGQVLTLRALGPGGLAVRSAGALRTGRDAPASVGDHAAQILEWDVFPDHRGRPVRVPRRWTGELRTAGERFAYEAIRSTEPRAVLGDGHLVGFDYVGRTRARTFEGEGYAEQLGSAWAADRRSHAVLS